MPERIRGWALHANLNAMQSPKIMPWKTHALLTVVCPVVWVLPAYLMRGYETEPSANPEYVMSLAILAVAWLGAMPLIGLEVAANHDHRRWYARSLAVAAHTWLAFVGTVPVWLTLYYPVSMDSTLQAVINYALLVVVYLAAVAAASMARSRDHDAEPKL